MNTTARRGTPTDTEAAWLVRCASVAASAAPPDPVSGDFAWLVWSWCRRAAGKLSERQQLALDALPAGITSLRRDIWVSRYLEVAARGEAGDDLSGGPRTAWLSRQRRRAMAGCLPAGRAELLSRLPGFAWTPGERRWESAFARVRDFVDTFGHIPARGDDEALAGWLATQRFELRSGRLSARRAQLLDTLPGWAQSLAGPRSPISWPQQLEALRDFVSAHRHYPRTGAADALECALAAWVCDQRDNHRRGDLSAARADALAAIPGWRWTAREADFDARAVALSVELGGRPIDTGHRFYSWVVSQRRRHRDGRLSEDQAAMLRALNLLDERLQASA